MTFLHRIQVKIHVYLVIVNPSSNIVVLHIWQSDLIKQTYIDWQKSTGTLTYLKFVHIITSYYILVYSNLFQRVTL